MAEKKWVSNLVRLLAGSFPQSQITCPRSLWHLAKHNKPPYMVQDCFSLLCWEKVSSASPQKLPQSAGGCYCSHHNQVFKEVLETLIKAKQSSKSHPKSSPIPFFFKAGEKPTTPLPFDIPTLHSASLAAESGSGKTSWVPLPLQSNSTPPRRGHFVQFHETGSSGSWLYPNRNKWKRLTKKALKIQGFGRAVQGTRLTSLLWPNLKGQLLQGVGPVERAENYHVDKEGKHMTYCYWDRRRDWCLMRRIHLGAEFQLATCLPVMALENFGGGFVLLWPYITFK